MRGALADAPSRSAYSARCGCTCALAARETVLSGQSRAAAKTKRTRRGIAAPCARGGIGSIVRDMTLRDIVATIRRRREPPPSAPVEAQADLIEVFKGERRMELKREGRTIRRYRVALGFSPERHKECEGDGRTPEGSYTV